jgi:hypothetical protein
MLPLRTPDRVVLLPDELPAIAATVVATTTAQATLLLDDGAVPARMLHRRRGALERTHDGRRFRGEGDIAMAEGRRGRVRDDTVVFHFRPPSRRSEPRAAASLPATLVPLDAPVGPARGLTLDISPHGVLLRSTAPLDPGSELQVHLQLPGEELPVPAAGAVVRRTADGLLGVRLDRMRPADRELVERWLKGRR